MRALSRDERDQIFMLITCLITASRGQASAGVDERSGEHAGYAHGWSARRGGWPLVDFRRAREALSSKRRRSTSAAALSSTG